MDKVLRTFTPFRAILIGHILFMVSGVFYALAWSLNFGDVGYMDLWYAKVPYYVSLISGGIGFIFLLESCRVLTANLSRIKIKNWHISLACLVIYTVALFLTSGLYLRKYTAELFLVMTWANIESCAVYALYYNGKMNKILSVASLVLVFIATVIGCILYNYYYSYTGYIQFNLGLYPYLVIVFAAIAITLFMVFGKSKPGPKVKPTFEWDQEFKKRGRVLIAIWFALCFLATLTGWVYILLYPWKWDMIANQLLLGVAFVLILLLLTPTIYASLKAGGDFGRSRRLKGVDASRARKLFDSLAREIEKGGPSVRKYYDQQIIPDMLITELHVLEVSEPKMLVLVKALNGWPNPLRTDIEVEWGSRDRRNAALCKTVEKLVNKADKN